MIERLVYKTAAICFDVIDVTAVRKGNKKEKWETINVNNASHGSPEWHNVRFTVLAQASDLTEGTVAHLLLIVCEHGRRHCFIHYLETYIKYRK